MIKLNFNATEYCFTVVLNTIQRDDVHDIFNVFFMALGIFN